MPDAIRRSPRRTSTIYAGAITGRRDTADGLEKGKEHFRRAIELDPSYALAYSGLADTYTMLGSDGFLPMSEAYPLGKAAALKALELDDMLGEAHNSLAAITVDYYWDWIEGGRHFERAIELNPNYEVALRSYSFYLACMGRHERGARVRRARAPSGPGVAERTDERWSGPLFRPSLRRSHRRVSKRRSSSIRTSAPPTSMLGRVYVAKGMPDRAVEELERAQRLLGPRPDVMTPHAYVLARAGRRREALATLDELRRISKPRDPSPFRIAMVHIGLGETDRAFEWLQKAFEARDWQMALLKVEPAFDGLRSDPRFAALLERVGLPR